MEKIKINHLDLCLYKEKLINGLQIYIIPKNNIDNIYVTFSTKYGSVDNDFIPINETEMYTAPGGVAHFLEHKVFEQKSGVDPLTFFTKNGANGNAFTNYLKTTYLFSGPDNFKNNLECLLDFVQDPYFTDENVEKEKGIIIEEIGMYEDNAPRKSFERIMQNTFCNDPIRYNVIGSVKSVSKITKEDLYKCYNTFYHPSNMFVIVTGNVNPTETIEQIKNNQNKKHFNEAKEIIRKRFEEPNHVLKEDDEIELNVTIPKIIMAYKFNKEIFNLEDFEIFQYLKIFSTIKFGDISSILEELKEKKIINDFIGTSVVRTENHIVLMIDGETEKTIEFENAIKEELKSIVINEEDFNRRKKSILATTIYISDDIFDTNDLLMNNISQYGEINADIYNKIKKLNYDDYSKFVKKLDFSNLSTLIVKPKSNK